MNELRVDGLQVRRGARTLLQVDSLAFAPGLVHAVLGPNGAGKSTLLSALAGLDAGSCAAVSLHGRRLADWPAHALARTRALLPQDHAVPPGHSAREVVELGRYPHRRRPHPDEPRLAPAALQRTGVAELAQRRYESLSGGERARVQLARVLAQLQPHPQDAAAARWLLLDEPTAALDLSHQHLVMRLLRELAAEGLGLVVVLHDLNLALRYADRVAVVAAGRVDSAGPCDAVLQPARIERVWGVRCAPVHDAGAAQTVRQFVFS